jgi:hypothetical protein
VFPACAVFLLVAFLFDCAIYLKKIKVKRSVKSKAQRQLEKAKRNYI